MNILYLLLLHLEMLFPSANSISNYDVELERTLKIGDDFFRRYRKNIPSRKAVLEDGYDLYKSLSQSTGSKDEMNLTREIDSHVILVAENGLRKLTFVGRYLKRKLDIKDGITHLINKAAKDYDIKFKTFVDNIKKDKVNCEIDKEYLFLQIVYASSIIMHSEAKKLLNVVVEKKTQVTDAEIKILTEKVFKDYVDHKKEEMNLLCEKLNICRPYPAFSDYFADFLSEIQKLSDDKMHFLLMYFKKAIDNQTHFFKSFIKEDIANIIGAKLDILFLDLYNIKNVLTVVRSIISQRYKYIKTDEEEVKIKSKAVRILLDIIDKAFYLETDDLTYITFDNTVTAIRQWQTGVGNDVDTSLKLFIGHLVRVIRNHWDPRTREEVMMLTEIMILGKSDDDEMYREVFTKGSAFMNNFINSFA